MRPQWTITLHYTFRAETAWEQRGLEEERGERRKKKREEEERAPPKCWDWVRQ